MNNNYLIPANSKRSMLILSFFKPIDLIIAGIGGGISFILLFTINIENIKDAFTALVPGLVALCMVLPVPNHRNVWQLTANIYNYFSNRRSYYWRGWCVCNDKELEKGNK